jgi:homoserine dehydrogenase
MRARQRRNVSSVSLALLSPRQSGMTARANVAAQRHRAREIRALTALVESPASATRSVIAGPVHLRIGLLGLGNVGSAVARLARGASERLTGRGFDLDPIAALVRTPSPARAAAASLACLTDDPDLLFAQPLDIVIEAIGGVEPAYSLVVRALTSGIPVVTANKSLVAARGDALADIARAHGVGFRYEAACIAGVPFLGTFAERPLATRAGGLTAILNGTSNAILSDIAAGSSFAAALERAQRLGLAEPDPSMDVSGRDAAEKLTILIALFGSRRIHSEALHVTGIEDVDPVDLRAAEQLGGVLAPIAHASWDGESLEAFVGPAFFPQTHPLARISGRTNGILIDAVGGRQLFAGPGAGPDVTAATILDDVCESAANPASFRSAERLLAATPRRPGASAWFVRIDGDRPVVETCELFAALGVRCTGTAPRPGRLYAVTLPCAPAHIDAAVAALRASTGCAAIAFPALPDEAFAC